MDKENRRKCFRCGCSPAKDNIKLFRFPKPSVRNTLRCSLWAKYIFPEQQYTSNTFQLKLFSEHRMLCQNHFGDEDFTDSSKQRLLRTAVPHDTVSEMEASNIEPQAGFSHEVPLCEVTNTVSEMVSNLEPQAGSSSALPLCDVTNTVFEMVSNLKPQAGSSSALPLCDVTNTVSEMVSNLEPQAGSSSALPLCDVTNTVFEMVSNLKPQAGSSSALPLCDVTNTVSEMVSNLEPQAGSSSALPLCDVTNMEILKYSTSSSDRGTNTECVIRQSEKEKNLKSKCTKYLRQIYTLRHRLKKLRSKKCISILSEDKAVEKLMAKLTPALALILQGQLRNCKKKLTGRRWTKDEKITSLRLFKRSPTCYRLLRRLFCLPSPSTLKVLLAKMPFHVGVNKAIFKSIKTYLSTQKPSDNNFTLMFDEMSLKKHLEYNPKMNQIDGYQDHAVQGREPLIAAYALVFMIAGIRKRVKQPIAHYFSSSNVTADRLVALLKEVLYNSFEAGIRVSAIVCDMDGVNRRAMAILGASMERPYININNQEIVTLFDTPHLIKCFRNLFLKYNIECTTDIKSNGSTGRGIAQWSHIEKFHQLDSSNPNFTYATQLRKDHLNPNSKQKMKVNLAVQVLSHSVAAGMYAKISAGELPTDASVTANICDKMDKLFDSVNSDSSDLRRGKPLSTNLTDKTPHLPFLEEMIIFFRTVVFLGCARTPPSKDGWIWTLNAIKRLWSTLKKANISSLALRRVQQDPLENLFGCIRGNCGSNTNPTTSQFAAGLKTAVLSNLAHIGTSGNCETDTNLIIENFDKLLSAPGPPRIPQEIDVTSTCQSIINDTQFEQALHEDTAEIQACAYVCGFIVKRMKTNCNVCKNIFLSKSVEPHHAFVECKEYAEHKKSLQYVSKSFVTCVESCATIVNDFLVQNGHTSELRDKIIAVLKEVVHFEFLSKCDVHMQENIHHIANNVFYICVKRFCVLKNRIFAEEASNAALKRKMKIILHQ